MSGCFCETVTVALWNLMANGMKCPQTFSGMWLDESVAEPAPNLPQLSTDNEKDYP